MTGAKTSPIDEDPRWQRLMARGGLITLGFNTPDAWPHGPLSKGEKRRDVGDDHLSAAYCTIAGHRFLRAQLLLPIQGARTVFAYDTWGSVAEESYQSFLAARAGGEAFAGAFAWLGNHLPGFDSAEPVPCNLVPGAPGRPPRLQPQPGTALHLAQSEGITAARLAEIYTAAGEDITALLTA